MERFEVLADMGTSALAEVLRVRDRQTGDVLVLKKLLFSTENDNERICREVEILKKLDHPNVVRYVDSFVDQQLHILMEHCAGGDLSSRIAEQRANATPFPEDQIWSWFCQIVEAVDYINQHGIHHRDLKPQNIFLTVTGVIKVGDFGTAKLLGDGFDESEEYLVTDRVEATQKKNYRAPELVDPSTASVESDIWWLGCILRELSNLKPTFLAPEVNGIEEKIVNAQCDPVGKEYSDELKRMADSLLQREPHDRPTSSELLSQCKSIMQRRATSGQKVIVQQCGRASRALFVLSVKWKYPVTFQWQEASNSWLSIENRVASHGQEKRLLVLPDAAVVQHENHVFVFDTRCRKTYCCVDAASGLWKEYPPPTTQRRDARAVVCENNIYLVGGYNNDPSEALDSFECFSPLSRGWIELPPLPYAVSLPAVSVHHSSIYVLGGMHRQRQSLLHLQVYQVKTREWTVVENVLSQPICGITATHCNGAVYLVLRDRLATITLSEKHPQITDIEQIDGGFSSWFGSACSFENNIVVTNANDTRCFDLNQKTMSTLPPLPEDGRPFCFSL